MPGRAGIEQWPDPAEFGFDRADSDPDHATAVTCRGGLPEVPLDRGCLIHYVRRVEDRPEMRVRLRMGGEHVAPGGDVASLTGEQRQRLDGMRYMKAGNACAMLVHSCPEMTRLAGFLPDTYREHQSRGMDPRGQHAARSRGVMCAARPYGGPARAAGERRMSVPTPVAAPRIDVQPAVH